MEDDRAAKAARAKALLNKRRANKVPGVATAATSSPTSAHPSPPASAYTPSIANQISPPPSVQDDETLHEAPLSRPATPDARRNSRSNGHDPYAALIASRTKSPLSSPPVDDSHLQRLVQNQQQTISLLVSEKASLTAALERLEGLDEKYGLVSGQLEASKRAAQTLESRSRDLEVELSQLQRANEQLNTKEKTSSENLRQRERDLDHSRKEVADLQDKSTRLESKLRDLQEHIQADDRVEKLEGSLKGLQERSNSLESQLARVKQSLNSTKIEKDAAVAEAATLKESESKLRAEGDLLRSSLKTLQTEFESLTSQHTTLQSTHSELSAQSQKHASSLAELTRKLSIESGKHTMSEKKLRALQGDVIAANRRAEEAELAHKGLQNENVGLMASLNEMRPRVMQLTEEKLSLTEMIERSEETRYELEGSFSALEGAVEEWKAKYETLEAEKRELEKERETDQDHASQDVERIQQALTQTEDELQSAIKSIKDLEAERNIHRQAVERYQLEMDRVDSELAQLRDQHSSLQDEYAMQRNAREADAHSLIESGAVVERAQAEVESLRSELYAKEEEIEQLRSELMHAQVENKEGGGEGKTPRPGHARSGSLDKEMFESDGTFELSAARSKVRLLESTVFQEQAKAHALRKQVSSLEEELHRVRRTGGVHHHQHAPPSPPMEEREMEMALDSALPPEVRHKRKISLSMLRARIDGEKALGASPRPAARHLSSLGATAEEEEVNEKMPLRMDPGPSSSRPSSSMHAHVQQKRRPQFLDDSHVFWCGSCRGDLVVL